MRVLGCPRGQNGDATLEVKGECVLEIPKFGGADGLFTKIVRDFTRDFSISHISLPMNG
jgi:hypothetical protein